jgi:hypothetical protein
MPTERQARIAPRVVTVRKNRTPNYTSSTTTLVSRFPATSKMLAYHPDKVANLAEEFQELAHQKTIEVRASYEELLRIVG